VLPLGLTSTQHSIEVLGRAAWRRVHYLVYPALVLTILHESLYMHDHLPERIAHIALVAVLIGERMVAGLRRARVTVG
jgi:DMSO/TMAO reductase YedYZ heme-binding membrane subunit